MLPSADLTDNPAASDKLATPSGETDEDTNAVVSPAHTDFLLTRIGAAFVGLAPAVPYVVLSGAAVVVAFNTYQEGEVSALTRTVDICWPVAAFAITIGAAIGLRRVVGSGDGRGQLAALGAGEARISQRAHRSLGRAHVWLSALTVLWVLMGLLSLVTATRVGTRSKLSGRLITEGYAIAVFLIGLVCINLALVFYPWYHTLKSASALVADAVAETRKAIERCSPTSPEWQSEVLPSVLRLCDETLPWLSDGWGDGVATSFIGFFLIAVGCFANFLEFGTPVAAFFTALFLLLPLGVSYDAAAASSDCDLLADALNDKRKRGDATDPDFEHAISRVEHILDRENTKQGLGFCVGHRVVDLKTLGNIVVAIVGVATTVVPILFSLRPSVVSIGDDVCSLTTSEIATIQGMMMDRNVSCAYNMSLSEILGM
eukprot:SAG31_NODE_1503_length_8079_cov_5.930827_7_plen_430_part_00